MLGPAAKTHGPDLRARLLALEPAAYKEFIEFFGPRLAAFYQRRGLTASEADELARSAIADIALKIRFHQSVDEKTFDGWVFTLGRHALMDWWRSRRIAPGSFDELT